MYPHFQQSANRKAAKIFHGLAGFQLRNYLRHWKVMSGRMPTTGVDQEAIRMLLRKSCGLGESTFVLEGDRGGTWRCGEGTGVRPLCARIWNQIICSWLRVVGLAGNQMLGNTGVRCDLGTSVVPGDKLYPIPWCFHIFRSCPQG